MDASTRDPSPRGQRSTLMTWILFASPVYGCGLSETREPWGADMREAPVLKAWYEPVAYPISFGIGNNKR